MSVRKVAFWLITISLLVAFIAVQVLFLISQAATLGYPTQQAVKDTYEMYAQFTDDPRMGPAVTKVRELVQEKGQLQEFWVSDAIRGRDATPTTVTVSVQRNGIKYTESVQFEENGTFIEITSTEVNRYAN